MLFTDSPYFTAVSDLLAVSPYLEEDLNPDANGNTVISIPTMQAIAANRIAAMINSMQVSFLSSRAVSAGNAISSNHLAGLGIMGSSSLYNHNNTPRLRLSQIVVTNEYPNLLSPLQELHLYKTVELIYEALARRGSVAQDRFTSLRDDCHSRIESVYVRQLKAVGIPWLPVPMPCPGAVSEPNSGLWQQSNLSTASSSGAPARSPLYVAITYVDQSLSSYYLSYSQPNNAESDLSQILFVSVPANNVAVVSISGLNPPTGNLPLYGPTSSYYLTQHTATGWNVYAGLSSSSLYLQNPSPIPISTSTFNIPSALLTQLPARHGQVAEGKMPVVDFTVFRR